MTGADILRIERATGQTFWDFACRWEDRDGIIAGDYVPHLYFDDEPATPFTICLLHHPSQTYPGTTRCRFLKESAPTVHQPRGTASCGNYAHRPAACRVFPLRIHTSSPLAIISDVPVRGRTEEGNPAYELCPRPWQPSDVDPLQGPQDVAVAEYEAAFFRQVAALWNERPSAWLKFPDFLRMVYERRVVKPEDVVAEPDTSGPVTLPFPSQRRDARYAA